MTWSLNRDRAAMCRMCASSSPTRVRTRMARRFCRRRRTGNRAMCCTSVKASAVSRALAGLGMGWLRRCQTRRVNRPGIEPSVLGDLIFKLGRRPTVTRRMQSFGRTSRPIRGLRAQRRPSSPRAVAVDLLGLEQADRGLGQGVLGAAVDRADRRGDRRALAPTAAPARSPQLRPSRPRCSQLARGGLNCAKQKFVLWGSDRITIMLSSLRWMSPSKRISARGPAQAIGRGPPHPKN